jgi:hypothetical protein
MKDRIKNIVVTMVFVIVIFGFMLMNIATPDAQLSASERRRLAQRPKASIENILSGALFEDLEDYLLDQFVFRDMFRGIKAFSTYYVFHQKDNNGIYIQGESIIKMEYRLNEKSVLNAAAKLNEIYDRFLTGKNVSYAVIPDKNYFTADHYGALSLDYQKMMSLMRDHVSNMNYIDLFGVLSSDDYYRTDIHWRQEKITDVADVLLKGMGNKASTSDQNYTQHTLYPFYGSYYGQAALSLAPDSLVYLTDTGIENAVVYDYETQSKSVVYVPEKFSGIDPYDVYLSGAKALITIENPNSLSQKELILFRDSFGSSMAPLLLKGYSKITLVDLRYIAADLLDDYIDFSQDQDVLFLYNTLVLNNSYMLK